MFCSDDCSAHRFGRSGLVYLLICVYAHLFICSLVYRYICYLFIYLSVYLLICSKIRWLKKIRCVKNYATTFFRTMYVFWNVIFFENNLIETKPCRCDLFSIRSILRQDLFSTDNINAFFWIANTIQLGFYKYYKCDFFKATIIATYILDSQPNLII